MRLQVKFPGLGRKTLFLRSKFLGLMFLRNRFQEDLVAEKDVPSETLPLGRNNL
ncbi:hypothetical protein PCOAH_00021040 [Plasmodium coatneyi]|uniref:SICA antigen n=1 Tax=Plasmodium coatneyi TaxID=208452 RepID=A0A1B1DYD1_9APIC|nr:hypothetical protein PCOAH_00021040 [Plasmodium coatneyi]ANQ07774.1 hypothetical protein PCOAH_00021040 [Plasmodium coatneyi]